MDCQGFSGIPGEIGDFGDNPHKQLKFHPHSTRGPDVSREG